ncbi:hypothetical protein FH609_004065 [Streptomyces sp. 3MP-14]|uniref:DUF6879 domain-containing protein n=1 Tax=Streptomyces mimosae TaxID=2586635 RepID=A0A5N6A5B7_9ACTN|nr:MULTISPECIES: DUF6879 family protein [Streptomyces]KAB8162910.1 hypothetical protein FH607_019930 [Streptomyces mimosae]KAB8179123.1 hypothetical protein FH609_004065 [Streptomyces sp. 3MP-14]
MPQRPPSFNEQLADCHQSAVHLEMRDVYGIAAEAGEFAAWKAGDDSSRRDGTGRRKAWLDTVRDATARGVEIRRARIVSEPVSEYIRFEHAGTALNIAAGEDVRWLPRRRASDIALPGNDFWLFDGRIVRFNHFSGDGASGGPEVVTDPAVVDLCASAFEKVWERAVPHADYQI